MLVHVKLYEYMKIFEGMKLYEFTDSSYIENLHLSPQKLKNCRKEP